MASNVLSAFALAVMWFIASLGLKSFSRRTRTWIETAAFIGTGLFLWTRGIPVFFAASNGPASDAAWWMRFIGAAWWLLGARVAVAVLWLSFHRDRRSRAERLFFDLAAALIYLTAVLVVMNSVFALPITGILATSGLMALVLGFALQNTLADVLAGVVVGIEAPFRVGDRIQLNGTQEGEVVRVNWRSIRLHTDGDDIAIVPNSVVAKAQIVNRSHPGQRRMGTVELSCPARFDPERIIESLLQATQLCPQILREPPASVAVISLGAARNGYAINFFVEETRHLSPTRDALLRKSRRQLFFAGLLDSDRCCRADDEGAFTQHVESRLAHRLLRDLLIFDCLSDQQIEALAAQVERRLIDAGEVLFAQDVPDKSLYVVASGVLELSRRNAGSEKGLETIGRIGAGEYVGEIGLLTGEPHAATATARTHSKIYRISSEVISPLLEENAALASALDQSVRRGLQSLHREVAAQATQRFSPGDHLLLRIRKFFSTDKTRN